MFLRRPPQQLVELPASVPVPEDEPMPGRFSDGKVRRFRGQRIYDMRFLDIFVYIPHDSCPLSTTALSNARSAGRNTSHWNSSAMIRSRVAPTPNSAAWPNPSDGGFRRRDSRGDRGWPSWRTTIPGGWRRISGRLRRDVL